MAARSDMDTRDARAGALVDAARALRPFLRGRAAHIERARRLDPQVLAALDEAGALRLQVPTYHGGAGADPATALGVIEELSRADASCGWCAMVASESSAFASALLEADSAREILSTPARAIVAMTAVGNGTAIPVSGGFRASGRFRFASGCRHAHWLAALCTVMDGDVPRTTTSGHPERRLLFAPVADARLIDTWHTSGLCGTASDDFEFEDVYVPARHSAALLGPAIDPSPSWRIPVGLRLALSKAAAVAGIARGAMDGLLEVLDRRQPFASTQPAREQARVHLALAAAEAGLEAGRALLYRSVDEIWQRVVNELPIAVEHVARGRLAVVHLGHCALATVDRVQEIAGTDAVFSAPIDRAVRDLAVARHHMQLQSHVQEDVGRVLVGLAPLNPLF